MFLSLKPACGYAEQAREQTNTQSERERENKEESKQSEPARVQQMKIWREKNCVLEKQ